MHKREKSLKIWILKPKKKAIENNRDINTDLVDWWDYVYDWAKEDGEKKGFYIDDIYFSGFSSQGDGACWVGSVPYDDWIPKHADEFPTFMKFIDQISGEGAKIYHDGFYSHSKTMHIDGDYMEKFIQWLDSEYELSEEDLAGLNRDADKLEDAVLDDARDFADEIYKRLEDEYEGLTSDEAIAETLIINDYEFDEGGNIV